MKKRSRYDSSDDDDDSANSHKNRRRSLPLPSNSNENKSFLDVMSDRPTSQASDESSPSFMDLINTFAALEAPSNIVPEPCPICAQMIPADNFADHVLTCITQLDDVEKQHVIELDRKMAMELSDNIPQLLPVDEDDMMQDGDSLVKFSRRSDCPDGRNCARTDKNHFLTVRHPVVNCSNCSVVCEMYELADHATWCLLNNLDKSLAVTTQENPTDAQQSLRSSSSPSTNNQSFGEIRESKSGMIGSDDEEDADAAMSSRHVSFDAVIRGNEDEQMGRERVQPTPFAPAQPNLSLHQLQAMSKHVLQKTNGNDNNDIFGILRKFKSLGFTHETLARKLKEEEDASKASNSQSSSSSSSKPDDEDQPTTQ